MMIDDVLFAFCELPNGHKRVINSLFVNLFMITSFCQRSTGPYGFL